MTHILVIEDEATILENILEVLEMEGYEAQGAPNGAIGINLARRDPPDLIICDIMLPGFSGFDVLHELRQDPETSETQFIFVTALDDRDSMRQGMDLGADDYITKPFTTEELIQAIQSRLSRANTIEGHAAKGLDKTKWELMRMVAHELRTPLIGINSVVEVLSRQRSQLSPDDLDDMLESIAKGSKRLTRVVEQMVFTMQLELGTLNYATLAEEGLPMLLRDIRNVAINMARRFAFQHQNLNIRIDEQDVEAMVMCHPAALKHAFAELLTNALVYSKPDGIVGLFQWRDGNYIISAIADEGAGIPIKMQKDAMEGFRQINRDKQEQQGMGLGLPLARRIIEAHGGALELNSDVGKGTEVVVRMPRYEAEPAVQATDEEGIT